MFLSLIAQSQLSKSTNNRHEHSPAQDSKTSFHSPPPIERLIALLTQKVLCKQLHQSREEEQTAANGIGESDHYESRGAGWVVHIVQNKANGLTDWCCRAVCAGHQPWFKGRWWEEAWNQRSDSRSKCEAFECLVEGYCHEQYNERCARGHAEGHADEDAVEENAGFEQEALEELPLRVLELCDGLASLTDVFGASLVGGWFVICIGAQFFHIKLIVVTCGGALACRCRGLNETFCRR